MTLSFDQVWDFTLPLNGIMLSFPFQLIYGKEDVMYSIMWDLNCIFYVTTNWPLGKITCSDALGIRRFKHDYSVVWMLLY